METKIIDRLNRIEAEAWDALVGDDNPFVEHAFLSLLEESGSVGADSGWEPNHVTVWDGDRLIAAAPTYRKDHSYGEYIFDWSWADAAYRLGLPYYPKLVVAVPFTPATGPRLLVHPEVDRDAVRKVLVDGLFDAMETLGAWSLHVLFCQDEEADFLQKNGLSRRATHQFHWRNNQYQTFDCFLGAMRSRCRKQVRRERRRLVDADLALELVPGTQVSPETWKLMHRLYTSTIARKWGKPYLSRAFFQLAPEKIAHRALLGFARRDGEIIAGTLSFAKGQHVYGRYWGAFENVDGLHFELCYYKLIEYAIERGCLLVEAGAQGSHKVKRGYLPVITHSAHAFRQRQIAHVFSRFMREERELLKLEMQEVQQMGPFRDDAIPPYPPEAGIDLARLQAKTGASDKAPSGS